MPTQSSIIQVYVGTYTSKPDEGIFTLDFNSCTGAMRLSGVAGGDINPSFLAIHPHKRVLYAVNEATASHGHPEGAVTAYAITATGNLEFLNRQPCLGAGPCYVSLDHTG